MIGQTIAHYQITGKLGEGGMGVVYKAEDTKLERTVALKFLAPHLLGNAEAKARFLREAKAAAGIDHPNICHVYEIGEEGGKTFISMAFVEGHTLEDRIAKGPLPIKDALDLARQVAEGLYAAHAKAIVHRDIKPANVIVSPAGRATIMDFGLARLTEASRLTKLDTAMGTVAYMSPEQAQGMEVDHRSDLWSLGCVVYEMVAGQRPFQGQYDQALLYEIVHEAIPPLTSVRAGVPMELEFIVAKCLAKDAADRYQHASDIAVDLRTLGDKLRSGRSMTLQTPNTAVAAPAAANAAHSLNPVIAPPQVSASRKWQVLAGVLAIALAAVSFAYFNASAPSFEPRAVRRFSFSHPRSIGASSISPDGRNVVFIAQAENRGSLWLRSMGSETARELPGTEGATQYGSGWSPDSRSTVFVAAGQLKRIAVDGGDPVVLCPLPRVIDRRAGFVMVGASFSPDGERIVYSFGAELWEVSALGGKPKLLFEPEPNADYIWPQFLPSGGDRQLLIFSMSEDRGAYRTQAMDLQTGKRHEVGPFSFATYATSGHLIHPTGVGLGATPFSIETLSAVGETFPIETSGARPSVSRDGTLVYTDTAPAPGRVVVRDRTGRIVRPVGDAFTQWGGPAIAPDGSRVAVSVGGDIWIYDLERDTATRLTSAQGQNVAPSWMASGVEVSYETGTGVAAQVADGSRPAKAVIPRTDGVGAGAASWSLDGRYVCYSATDPAGGEGGIWYREVGPGGVLSEPVTYLRTPFQETMSQISPNSRYLAYRSNESGRQEIYVRPFPEGSAKWQVSTNGGHAPRWAADGTELFYREETALMAVRISTSGTFTSGRPQRLYETPNVAELFNIHPYDVFPDGKRFVMIARDASAATPTVRIVENWATAILAR